MAAKVFGNLKKGLLFVVSAPAGTGKTTLVNQLTHEFSEIVQSVSFTTRKPRPGEIEGVHYHFISKEGFKEKIKANDFLEHVSLYGDYYGTCRAWVENHLNQGRHVVLVIDTQGGLKIKGSVDATFIFIRPPSLDILRKRLEGRKTEPPEMIQKRIARAEHEMEEGKAYDYQIINDDLSTAYQVLKSIFIAEEHRLRNINIQEGAKQWTNSIT